jgi:hypothetical protein
VDLTDVADEKNTTAESCTSSMQCTEKYLREAGSEDTQKIATFWYNVARYGRLGVMEWTLQHFNVDTRAYGANRCTIAGSLTAKTFVLKLPSMGNLMHCRS